MIGKSVMLFGLPLILLGSVTIHSDICRVPTQPVVTAPSPGVGLPEPTTTVEGTTTQHSTVTMKTNDRPLGNVMSDASGDFQMQVVLDRGENHLSVQTSNPCGTSSAATIDLSVAAEPEPEPSPPSAPGNPTPLPDAHSSPDSIIPGSTSGQETPGKGTAPSSSKNDTPSTGLTLEITSPKDNSSTSEDSIFISGVTSKETTETIAVNGKETARLATPSSTFGVLVPLHMGKNLIKVVATAGDQSAVAWLHVTRVKPSQQPLPWYEQYQWLLIPPAAALTAFLTVVLLRQRRRQ